MSFTTPVKTWNVGDAWVKPDLDTYITANTQWLHDSGLFLISQQVLAATTSSVTFASIPQTFSHLWVEWEARGDTTGGNTNLYGRANGDSAADYDWYQVFANGATPGFGAADMYGQTFMELGHLAASGAPANVASQGGIRVRNYSAVTFQKTFRGESDLKTGTSAGSIFLGHFSAFWRSGAAITSMTFFPQAGNFVAGSAFTLIGIP